MHQQDKLRTEAGERWTADSHGKFQKKFGKVTRHGLPAMQCDLNYQEVIYKNGIDFKLNPDEYVQKAKAMILDANRMK